MRVFGSWNQRLKRKQPTFTQAAKVFLARPDKSIALFLCAFVTVWTLAFYVARFPAPVFDDVAEAWAWGHEPSLGYYKHPPFFAVVAYLWFEFFSRSDLSACLLAAVNAATGLFGVWMASGCLLNGTKQATSVLVLALTPFWTVMAANFNANTILLALWPWTMFAFLKSLETRSVVYGILLGAFAAMCMLSKYISIFLLLSLIAAALLHMKRRDYLKSAAPYAAVLVFLLLVAPHVWWLIHNDFPTVSYAMKKTRFPVFETQTQSVRTLLGVAASLIPIMLGLWLAAGTATFKKILRTIRNKLPADMRWLAIIALGPLIMTLATGLLGLVSIVTSFTIPMTFLIPAAVLVVSRVSISATGLGRVMATVAVYSLVALIAAPAISVFLFKAKNDYAMASSRSVALESTRLWKEVVGGSVKIVAGSERISLGVVFYSPDKPSQFTHFSYDEAPWISPARIARQGMLIVCDTTDAQCYNKLRNFVTPQTIERRLHFATHLIGQTGSESGLDVFVIPPRM